MQIYISKFFFSRKLLLILNLIKIICYNNNITQKQNFSRKYLNVFNDKSFVTLIVKCNFDIITDCRGIEV